MLIDDYFDGHLEKGQQLLNEARERINEWLTKTNKSLEHFGRFYGVEYDHYDSDEDFIRDLILCEAICRDRGRDVPSNEYDTDAVTDDLEEAAVTDDLEEAAVTDHLEEARGAMKRP